MINKYEVDKKLKKEIRREQIKKHPKWEQRKIVRIILKSGAKVSEINKKCE